MAAAGTDRGHVVRFGVWGTMCSGMKGGKGREGGEGRSETVSEES